MWEQFGFAPGGSAEDKMKDNFLKQHIVEGGNRSEEHTSELQSRRDLVCRLLLEKKKTIVFLLLSLIMFKTFISRHNSHFFSDKLVLTSVTPASLAPDIQKPKATSSQL